MLRLHSPQSSSTISLVLLRGEANRSVRDKDGDSAVQRGNCWFVLAPVGLCVKSCHRRVFYVSTLCNITMLCCDAV